MIDHILESSEFTKYETARIVGARALQISMNAPLLIKMSNDQLEEIKYDAIKIAEIELNSHALPISVNKPMPRKHESELKRVVEIKVNDAEIEAKEVEEEEEIAKGGEIMSLANPEEEIEEENDVPEELQ